MFLGLLAVIFSFSQIYFKFMEIKSLSAKVRAVKLKPVFPDTFPWSLKRNFLEVISHLASRAGRWLVAGSDGNQLI